MKKRDVINATLCAALLSLLTVGQLAAQTATGPDTEQKNGRRAGPPHQPPPFPAPENADVIVGRPASASVTLSVRRNDADGTAELLYWAEGSNPASATIAGSFPLSQAEPRNLHLQGLRADTVYFYQLRVSGQTGKYPEGRFRTARSAGQPFQFTITADSHLDQNTSTALYRETLHNIRQREPDFHIDLGDTFMTDKYPSRDDALRQYQAQRIFFSSMADRVPLFLVLGNHDGEDVKLRRGPDNLAVWANTQRRRYFPNPQPDSFYSGAPVHEGASALEDYYAWQWGDAQMIVLNPYWYGPERRAPERWNLSLGDQQYAWLEQTLRQSKAAYIFVFIHQLAGGADRQGRGGAEAVPFGEWGGLNADGTPGMAANRPGWKEPVHALLHRYRVSAVFHGHDHLYASQQRDGIIYQEVPQPAHSGGGDEKSAAEYGYLSGTVLAKAGFMQVSVSPQMARVALYPAGADTAAAPLHSYQIAPRKP